MHHFLKRTDNEHGASAVEFALILPLLVVLVFGITEFGLTFSQYQVYQGAAREGGRYAAVRPADTGIGPTADQIRTKVVSAAEPYDGNISSSSIDVSTQCTPDTTGDVVTVSWEQPVTIEIPLLPVWDIDLEIKSAFRCE